MMGTWPGQAPSRSPGRHRPIAVVIAAVVVVAAVALVSSRLPEPSPSPSPSAGHGSSSGAVAVYASPASSFDPVVQSDAASAQIVAQLYESLTAIDSAGHVQPALASGWTVSDGGKRLVFQLRPGLKFSDGSALAASDVVASWMRVISPDHPSQLASLLDDVAGARSYREGVGDASTVGLSAPAADRVQVDFIAPASDFPAVVSSPTLAVAPAKAATQSWIFTVSSFIGSGGYVLSADNETETTLKANPYYWAGPPAIATVHVLHSIGGKSPVTEFENGNLDYTPISVYDASWIAYDRTLGPSLRIEPSPSIEYYGFDTTKAPFSDVHVRRAFQMGIDWRRLVDLQADSLEVPATGMVPAGVPGHSATDYGPVFDLQQAKAELATAGYPDGAGFPKVMLVTAGAPLDEAIVRQVHDNLGIDLTYEALDWTTYNTRLLSDPPAMWNMGWVADYPGANDFLGILLGSGQINNFGRWSSSDFDAAIASAQAATNSSSTQQAFDRAEAIVNDQAPVIPVDYGSTYSLANPRLLGAVPNGQGLVRYAGLAWAGAS